MPERLLRAPQVGGPNGRTGLSVRSVKRKAANPEDDFPAGLRLSDRITVWIEREVDAWIDAQIAKHRGTDDAPSDAPAATNGHETAENGAQRAGGTRSGSPRQRQVGRRGRKATPIVRGASP